MNNTKRHSGSPCFPAFLIHSSWFLGFLVSRFKLLSFVNHELVSVGIAELCHPADRCLGLFNIEFHAAVFELRVGVIKIFHLERDGCPVARRFPSRMTTHADGDGAKIVLDPRAIHLCAGRL